METLNWNLSEPTTSILLFVSLCIISYGSQTTATYADTVANSTNVILLAYHRSGSSFVGETLAVHQNFSYFFEPLFYDNHILQNYSGQMYQTTLQELLTCDVQTLDNLRNQDVWIIRKFGQNWSLFKDVNVYPSDKLAKLCASTPIHLAKTIRLRVEDALGLVRSQTVPNLKIIHLVRDPRARFNSASSKLGTWTEKEKSVDIICGNMEQDAQLVDAFPKDIYRRIKYEDVVNDPKKVTRDLYENFIGVGMTPEVEQYIDRHTNAEHDTNTAREALQYYSTFRTSDFDHEHWKHNLNKTAIREIQQKCRYVLDKFGYELMDV